jgi:predicted tellurium resistance membrane protein TerC
MEWIIDPQNWIAFLTLTSLEIVLGIDNIIFISILAGALPENEQDRARKLGLVMAMFTRILLLLSLTWLTRLTFPLFTLFGHVITGRGIIMMAGGLFLLGKSTFEIHDKLEGEEGHASAKAGKTLASVVIQIMLLLLR